MEKYLQEIHEDHLTWNKSLGFTSDEINSFENRLNDLVVANTTQEVLAKVEMFQNRFVLQKEMIDTLLHAIHEDELRIARNARENNVATEHRKLPVNKKLESDMLTFENLYTEMKNEFLRFLSITL